MKMPPLRLPRRDAWFAYLTFSVAGVTAVSGLIGLAVPSWEENLRRDPTLIADGQWYRLVTSLVVQDGGAFGLVFNVGTLLVLGILAERRLGRWRWLVLYLGGAAAGQAMGYLAGTVGAGNSIANLGLAGGLIAAFARHRAWRIDAALSAAVALLIGLTALPSETARAVGLVLAVVLGGFLVARRELFPRWVFLAIAVVVGVALSAVADLHGPALLAGLVLGAVITGGVVLQPEPRAGEVFVRRPR
jgi:membrane associated rhomboid family serine protease